MANVQLAKSSNHSQLFKEELLAKLKPYNIPEHVAIIPDGNRRWARSKLSPIEVGHREGCNVVTNIVDAASTLGVKALTIYSFSTENWMRPEAEVQTLMHLLTHFLVQEREVMVKKNVRLKTIGQLSSLPETVQRELEKTIDATKASNGIDLILALNYGSKDEITRAFRKMAKKVKDGLLDIDSIHPKTIEEHLDTHEWPLPDLLIRTGGVSRVSNFLLWQLAYAEFYISEVMWPEFTPDLFLEAIISYQQRERRLGQ